MFHAFQRLLGSFGKKSSHQWQGAREVGLEFGHVKGHVIVDCARAFNSLIHQLLTHFRAGFLKHQLVSRSSGAVEKDGNNRYMICGK